MPKLLAKITADPELTPQLQRAVAKLTANSEVERYTFTVNKKTGIAVINARGSGGRTVTKEMFGPGLTATTVSNPDNKQESDHNIVTLLKAGLTQVEVAMKVGKSQSHVSVVKRRAGL